MSELTRKPTYHDAILSVRLLRRLRVATGHALPLAEVADALAVSPRSVQRYVDAIGDAVKTSSGSPIVWRERRGRVPYVVAAAEATLAHGLVQYASVFAASRWLAAGPIAVLDAQVETLLQSLQHELGEHGGPTGAHNTLARVRTAFHYVAFGPKDYRAQEDVIDALVLATLHNRPVQLWRDRRDGTICAERVEPYTIVMYRDGLYLLGRRVETGAVRLFSLERVRDATVLRKESFTLPPDFDPAAAFADQLGLWDQRQPAERLVIAFDPGAAQAVSLRRWPGDPSWRTLPDGRQALTITVPITPEVVTWAASWGGLAEVLSPPHLRDAVVAVLRAGLARYGAADSPKSAGSTPDT